jgi:hypothetical protein
VNRVRLKLSTSGAVIRYISDDTVYWIEPQKIVFAMNSEGFGQPATDNQSNYEFRVHEYKGRVIDGDWDKLQRKFCELDFYRSYEERARKGTGWEQLPYYRRVLGQIERGMEKWGCKCRGDLDERCRRLDQIYYDIKQNGYKSRAMQRKEGENASPFDEDDEITVNIGRHGDLIFNNGRHRLTLAKVAGVERVPVNITVRHSEWEKFVNKVEAYVQKNDGRVQAPLTHIGLQHISVPRSDERFEIIRRSIGEGNNTLLDIGAHWGYFCHRFEESGFRCTAVESDPESLYFLKKLRRAENREFEIIAESILTLCDKGPLKYDIVLALDIYHDLSGGSAFREDWKKLLRSLDMNEMYLELYAHDEIRLEGVRVSLSPEEVIGFVLENSCLSSYQLLGKYEEIRELYKLWR